MFLLHFDTFCDLLHWTNTQQLGIYLFYAVIKKIQDSIYQGFELSEVIGNHQAINHMKKNLVSLSLQAGSRALRHEQSPWAKTREMSQRAKQADEPWHKKWEPARKASFSQYSYGGFLLSRVRRYYKNLEIFMACTFFSIASGVLDIVKVLHKTQIWDKLEAIWLFRAKTILLVPNQNKQWKL